MPFLGSPSALPPIDTHSGQRKIDHETINDSHKERWYLADYQAIALQTGGTFCLMPHAEGGVVDEMFSALAS